MSSKHHVLGPSSYSRWSACPGSLVGPETVDDAGDAAKEGTACHALAEFCLNTGLLPETMLGKHFGDERFPVNQDMVEGAQLYLNTVRSVSMELGMPLSSMRTEQYLTSKYIPRDLFGGTTDLFGIHDGTLLVVDFKYGRVPVKATSGQLTCYALLAMGVHPPDAPPIKRVVQILVQPRSKDGEVVTRHEPSQQEIAHVWEKIQQAAQVYLQYKDAPVSPDKFLKTGSHCEYCRRKRTCPAFLRDMADSALMATFPVQPIVSDEEINTIMYWLDREAAITKFLAACHVRLLEVAQQGRKVPGKKLVATWSNRKWFSDDSAQVLASLSRYGIDPSLVTEQKVASPAQVEKVLKAHPGLAPRDRAVVIRDINDRLVRRVPTGCTLKDESAKGEEIAPVLIQELIKIERQKESDE